MKAFVTGGSGFIGSALIEALNAQGVEVTALLRRPQAAKNLLNLRYNVLEGDLSDVELLKKGVQGVDYVFHLAGVTTAMNRAGFFENNALATGRLAQAVAESNPGVKRFIYVSSLAAGGPAQALSPRQESLEDQPVSDYGRSKWEGEKALLRHRATFPMAIVRPPLVYGPRDRGVFLLIQSVARNIVPVLPRAAGVDRKYYSAIHVQDLCQGLIQVAQASLEQVPSGEVFYLADDGVYSDQELFSTIASALNKKPWNLRVPRWALSSAALGLSALSQITGKPAALSCDKLKEIFPDYWICSNQKARKAFQFKPSWDLQRGMAHTIDWYRKERWL